MESLERFCRHREGEERGREVSERGERRFCVERERGNVVDEYGQPTVNSGTIVDSFKKVREVQARLYEQFKYIKNSTRRITNLVYDKL
jgi:hypothetical protein